MSDIRDTRGDIKDPRSDIRDTTGHIRDTRSDIRDTMGHIRDNRGSELLLMGLWMSPRPSGCPYNLLDVPRTLWMSPWPSGCPHGPLSVTVQAIPHPRPAQPLNPCLCHLQGRNWAGIPGIPGQESGRAVIQPWRSPGNDKPLTICSSSLLPCWSRSSLEGHRSGVP